MRTHSRLAFLRIGFFAGCLAIFAGNHGSVGYAADAPAPLLKTGQAVDWWFVFKFNVGSFPDCGGPTRTCIFGGTIQNYHQGSSQQFVFAGKGNSSLRMGNTCIGDTVDDPVGATFSQVYNGSYYYVIWNDQFHSAPEIPACGAKGFCDKPWGHSKGMLAWNDAGNGFVMQVSTPNWPGAGNKQFSDQRMNGNTLGCMTQPAKTGGGQVPQDDVEVSQHFFALRLNKDDVVKVLTALNDASVVTAPSGSPDSIRRPIVNNGGPPEIRQLVDKLGVLSTATTIRKQTLSSGVQLISKPSELQVPPWLMVSAVLGGVPLKVATWWEKDKIPDTDGRSTPGCWGPGLGQPGPVTNATGGHWNNKPLGLTGGAKPDGNHAKIGASTSGNYAIFGDMNQEGAMSGDCNVSQNARGGMFFVVQDATLSAGLRTLMADLGANSTPPKKGKKTK